MNKTFSMVAALTLVALAGPAAAAGCACDRPVPVAWHNADCDCEDRAPMAWHAAWYAGASASQSTFGDWSIVRELNDGSYRNGSEDDGSAGYRLFAGMELLEYLGLEAGYGDLGKASYAAQSDGSGFIWDAGPVMDHIELAGFDVSVLAKVPLPGPVAVVGQIGALRWETEASASGSIGGSVRGYNGDREAGMDALYGARLEFDGLPSTRLSLGYLRSHFNAPDREGASLESITLSAAYRF